MRPGAIAGGLLALIAAACGGAEQGPPEILLDSSTCANCRMLVSELAYAAALRTPEGEELVFDEIGCLLRGLPAGGARVWVRDYETTEWIPGEEAFYVRSESIQTPMGGGIVAFSTREKAQRYGAEPLAFDQLKGETR